MTMRRAWTGSLGAMIVVIGLAACAGQTASSNATGPTPNAIVELVTPYPTLDTAQVARGRQIYSQRCASCHGATAQGAPGWATPGPDGPYLPPAHDDSGHTWHHSDRVLYETVRDGMRDPLKPKSPLRMPAFGDKLSDAELRAVITYLKSLWLPANRQYQFDETRKDFAPPPPPPPPTC